MNETTYEIVGRLFEKIFDGRRIKENRKVIIFSPVGNHAELELFSKYIKKIGLDKKNEVDFLFIYRKGLEKLDVGLSAIHATEKYPIGTSGSFFAGQATCYSLGYEYIIVTDCDALIDSLETFEDMLEIAKTKRKVVSAPTFADEKQKKANETNPNGWGFFSREIFEKSGFSIPFTWRGGDDFEIAYRLDKMGLRTWYMKGKIYHPMAGYTIYHRVVNKNKYYPYANGIMKALLFIADYDKKYYFKYMLWSLFNYFFSILLDEPELGKIVDDSARISAPILPAIQPNSVIMINKNNSYSEYETTGLMRYGFIPYSLMLLILDGKFNVHDSTILLKVCRPVFFIRLMMALFLTPYYLCKTIWHILCWRIYERKKVIFPIMPNVLEKAIVIMINFFKK